MSQPRQYSVVSPDQAALAPYPYVFVNEDASVRELHQAERAYLETRFAPSDGARPFVKNEFDSRDGWGTITGFCARSAIPENIPIAAAPAESPIRPLTKSEHIARLKRNLVGFEITELPDGTVSARRGKKPRSWSQRLLDWLATWRTE